MKRAFLLTLLLAVVCLPVYAQTTGSIRGTVTDPSGGPVAEAAVTVLNAETGFTRSGPTNASGIYNFSNLPVGTYLVTVEVEGFKSVLVQNIVLNVADVREVNAQLELGELSDQMTVTSSSIVVETIGGEVAGLITGEQMRELPLNGRNFLQLTQLMPGVSTPDGFNTKNKGLLTGSDMSVSGGGVTANVFTVDGANNNDGGSNRTVLVYPSVEALEEFKIHRNAYGAEFGGAGGAQINLVTRGGTNNL
ncbi:MAG: carboxypeptidase-like regulatory domain-containing protein, partial [Acidimicrobiia bacterium]|nr:carboxypeptidase-like regulatory domain-containing protein [Acidimicrobiia bacterium]